MQRYKIRVQYDGSEFYGWQQQKSARTVQSELERALSVLNAGQRSPVIGAGRTDSGVHATGQVAHFDLATVWSPPELLRALNGNLPEDLRIRDCELVEPNFHARFSARRRSYEYHCRIDDFLLDRNHVWNTGPLDMNAMEPAAALIRGEHDFRTFSKIRRDLPHHRCTIYQSLWKEDQTGLIYVVVANRFLHHMVRYLVGSMVAIGQGKISLARFEKMLNEPVNEKLIFRAPARGLILTEVSY
ncbi:MAG: tRNA pseudouridine(38-40) synthase TruA [Candidatus Neomarinimicrobiota bacterium]